jgi:hypothetical protein
MTPICRVFTPGQHGLTENDFRYSVILMVRSRSDENEVYINFPLENGKRVPLYVGSPEAREKTDHLIVYNGSVSGNASFYLWRPLSVGTGNAKRKMSVVFASFEPEDNTELLHLLHDKMKP